MFRKTLLLTLFGFSYSALANDAQTVTERQRLESVVYELAYLQAYLEETKSSQKHNVRSRFDYQRLDSDLNVLKQGISEYLSDFPSKPKGDVNTLRTIEGNYTR